MSKILSEDDKQYIKDSIRSIPDYPKKGVIFRDITTLLNNPKAFSLVIDHLVDRYKNYNLDYIAAIESRGFIFGTPLAKELGVGFVPIRKKGKLPYTTISQKYALEYGHDELEVHIDAFSKNSKVLLIDDLLATGGTAQASINLISNVEDSKCVECCFIISLEELNGIEKVKRLSPVYKLIEV